MAKIRGRKVKVAALTVHELREIAQKINTVDFPKIFRKHAHLQGDCYQGSGGPLLWRIRIVFPREMCSNKDGCLNLAKKIITKVLEPYQLELTNDLWMDGMCVYGVFTTHTVKTQQGQPQSEKSDDEIVKDVEQITKAQGDDEGEFSDPPEDTLDFVEVEHVPAK